ncbi:MAG TPA: ABC transporter substrate-binding protein [Pseudolabrys sp.]|jgi:NitT/TauT family transport system substrate-binding protein|nr:ABC transporter substrate-binding protein [Pseudolabrys sp.]
MIGINNGCGTRNWQRIATLIAHLILVAALFAPGPVRAAAEKDYGKQGEPIELVIGYQPYYTQAWSGVIMRDKKFYEKYLPKGSSVSFQVGLQGAIIVNGMLAGKVDIGYLGDMPAIVSTSHADVRDLRIVSVLGLGYDQCNAFLVRTDAPEFKSSDEAIKWLNGKTVAVPKGSCTDRFAQAVFKRFNIAPSEYLNQSIEVITSGFRAKKLDAAVMWEPTTSRLELDKLARKVATGASVNERDGGFMSMPQALIAQRPDIVKAWLQAELDAEEYFADPKNAMEIAGMAASQTTGFPQKALWQSAFGSSPKATGGTDIRITLAYGFTPDATELIQKASKFLVEIKSINAEIRPDAVMPQFTAEILKARGLTAPVGEVKAQPDSAYTGP